MIVPLSDPSAAVDVPLTDPSDSVGGPLEGSAESVDGGASYRFLPILSTHTT